MSVWFPLFSLYTWKYVKRKRIPIFFSLVTLFSFSLSLSLCSFFHCYYYYYYYCRFSCVACSHLFSSLSSLTKSQGGEAVSDFDYRLFFFFLFFLSLLLLLLEFVSFQQREREGWRKTDVGKNKVVTTLIQSAFFQTATSRSISSQNITSEARKQKLYYPPEERTSARCTVTKSTFSSKDVRARICLFFSSVLDKNLLWQWQFTVIPRELRSNPWNNHSQLFSFYVIWR